jgi:hypothetical protein
VGEVVLGEGEKGEEVGGRVYRGDKDVVQEVGARFGGKEEEAAEGKGEVGA